MFKTTRTCANKNVDTKICHCVKCPNTEYLSAFNPNAGKYGPEKTPYFVTFHAVCIDCLELLKIAH